MRNEDREEDAMVGYIARSAQLTIRYLNENIPTYMSNLLLRLSEKLT